MGCCIISCVNLLQEKVGVLTAVNMDIHISKLVLVQFLLDFHGHHGGHLLASSIRVATTVIFGCSKGLVNLNGGTKL